jgi:hypothetical protein
MAAVALQREINAYADAIDKYNRQARSYSSAAAKHNEDVAAYNDASKTYNESFLTYKSGVDGVKASAIGQVKVFTPEYGMGNKIHSYYDIYSGNSIFVPAGYTAVKDPSGYYVMQKTGTEKINVPKPGEFTMQQPTQPGAAPTGTVAQMRRLDEPSLIDVERNVDRGLISKAFNF